MKNFDIENGILYNYRKDGPHVVIPKRVTKIGNGAFFYNLGLTSITIPNSVTEIGDNAFSYCVYLMDIKIPKSVTIIDDNAFKCCRSLKSIKIPDGVTKIGERAFAFCDNLSNVNISSSVTSIGSCVFTDIKDVIPQYNANSSLRAFKAFNKDWTCMYDFKYEVGKSYHQDRNIIACKNGFHACPNPLDVFNYYHGELSVLHFAEVELSGDMDWKADKVAASDIKIVRELTVQDLCEIYNSMEKEK